MSNSKKSQKKTTDKKKSAKELVKPVDIKNEEEFFEAKSLCSEYGKGDDCVGNKGVDAEDDLLF